MPQVKALIPSKILIWVLMVLAVCAAQTHAATTISPLESRRFVQMDALNAQYLMPIAMRLGGEGETLSDQMKQLYRAQMGFIATQMTRDPTVPVPDYAECLAQFDGTESSVPVICKLTIDKVMSKFAMAKAEDNQSAEDFMLFSRVFTLSQSSILAISQHLKQPFTPAELDSIASYHAFRLTQEKDSLWLNLYRTCVESNSQTINCKRLQLDKVAADLTLDYLKAINKETSYDDEE